MPLIQTTDLLLIFQWWSMICILGLITLPLTALIFYNFFDKGYIFSKVIGILFFSYTLFLLGTLHILPFTRINLFILLGFFVCLELFIILKNKKAKTNIRNLKKHFKIFMFEELLFFIGLLFWAYIKSFQPDIHGLEKYMDFGFINSILRTEYFPAKDMWFTPFTINYYYFGHIVGATLTKLSAISSYFSYNLILATIFSFCFSLSFSIGANLIYARQAKDKLKNWANIFSGGIISAILVTLGGNLHTVYTLFLPYQNEFPKPFWELAFSPLTFPNAYWYPNATRFIYNTIHEFPSYSFVVSDLHGHVFSIPIVLTIIAVLFSSLITFRKYTIPLLGFLLACAYMTNAWDGIIYFLLSCFIIFIIQWNTIRQHKYKNFFIHTGIIAIFFLLFSIPFSLFFKPFVSGVGILCAPEFLTNIGKLGPFLFEANHCQHSPWWQLIILYGFFYFWVIVFIGFTFRWKKKEHSSLTISDLFIISLILLATLLIIIPEFIYMKDIYPAHFRANTMFKLVYQSFIMLSLASGYSIITSASQLRFNLLKPRSYWKLNVIFLGITSIVFVLLYPIFAIESYFSNLNHYYGLNGISYLERQYPTDYDAIIWIQKNISGQPIIAEAQGDSYTDFARVSANTGLPTILGWTVHEWLWRGTYDIPAPRIAEIQTLYETNDTLTAERIIKKYNISYIFVGTLEKEKYPLLNESVFKSIATPIYRNASTTIYKIN